MNIIFIVGPTASGKTGLAIDLAIKINAEIICADSRTIYRGLEIATAVPTIEERRGVRHHLLGILDAGEVYSSAQFVEDSLDIIRDLERNNKNAIIVGGSGNYISSLYYEYSFRKKIRNLKSTTKEDLIRDIYDLYGDIELTSDDLGNKRRLEKMYTHGLSQTTKQLRFNSSVIIGLNPDLNSVHQKNDVSLPLVKERIAQRFEEMLKLGVIEEVKKMSFKPKAGNLIPFTTTARVCGQFLREEFSIDKLRELVINENYKLARKQLTYFKTNKNILWFDNPKKAEQYILDSIN